MGFSIPKYNAPLECFAIWSKGFTEEEIEKIVFLEKLLKFERGKVGNFDEVKDKARVSEVSWIHPDANSDWLFHRFAAISSKVNYDHFMFNIEGLDAFQYTKYGEHGHYDWHIDTAFGWENYQRKLSAVMLLNNPDEYEGGEFEIVTNGNINEPKSFKPNKGDIVYFASWMPHRVAPVTGGERKSLVTWIGGKRDC